MSCWQVLAMVALGPCLCHAAQVVLGDDVLYFGSTEW
jgi:hypothetical protein